MVWNWQLPNWPNFIYDSSVLVPLEQQFLQGAGGAFAVLKHLEEDKRKQFVVELLCNEGITSSEIEGEILQRASLQSSIKRHFGFDTEHKKISRKEENMGHLMWQVYETYDQLLTHAVLCEWHKILMQGEEKLADIGKYRTHIEPMQIVSGQYDQQKIYFEAPPSDIVYKEMDQFIKWFNACSEKSILGKAAIVHLYFESIHPFEDGNGRIGRALAEKVLSQSLHRPTLIAVSAVISKRKKEYYEALASCNTTLNINAWVQFFAKIVVEAQKEAVISINFLMVKAQLLNQLKGTINTRQEKVLIRMFAEGTKGFVGGLSAENYIAITKTSRATATRDLTDLVEKKALYKTGELKHTRYWLNIPTINFL